MMGDLTKDLHLTVIGRALSYDLEASYAGNQRERQKIQHEVPSSEAPDRSSLRHFADLGGGQFRHQLTRFRQK